MEGLADNLSKAIVSEAECLRSSRNLIRMLCKKAELARLVLHVLKEGWAVSTADALLPLDEIAHGLLGGEEEPMRGAT
jgi:hypothetical protein